MNPHHRTLTRRRFLKSSLGLLAAGTATYTYASTATVYDLTIEHLALPIPNLPKHLHNTKIIQLSDLHAGSRVSFAYLERTLHTAADMHPDFLLITGDFVDSTLSHLDPLCKLLEPIAQKIPTYGCTGNHDFFNGHPPQFRELGTQVANTLSSVNINMLRNQFHLPTKHSALTTQNYNQGDLCFVGLEDYSCSYLDPSTLARAPQDATTILLSHNPDSYDVCAPYRFHIMLSGHTHGGQICIPGIGPLKLPIKHRERAAGLLEFPSPTPNLPPQKLYVSRGVGHLLKIRLNCPPELTVITLIPA